MSDLLDRLRSLGIEYEQGPYGQPLLRLPGSRQFVAPTGVVKPLAGVEQSAMQRLEEMSAGWVQGIKSETPLTPEERYAQAEPAIRASLRQEPRWAENWQQAYPQQLQARRASTYAVSTEEGEYISPWDLRSQFGTEGRFFRPGGGSDERDVAGKMTGRREPLRAIDVGTIATIPGVVQQGDEYRFGAPASRAVKQIQLAAQEKVGFLGREEETSSIIAQKALAPETGYRANVSFAYGVPNLSGQGYRRRGWTPIGETVQSIEIPKEDVARLELGEAGRMVTQGHGIVPFAVGGVPYTFRAPENWDRALLQSITKREQGGKTFVDLGWQMQGGGVSLKWGGVKSQEPEADMERMFPTAGDVDFLTSDIKNPRMVAGMVLGAMPTEELQRRAAAFGATLQTEGGRVRWGPENDPALSAVFMQLATENLQPLPWQQTVARGNLFPFALGKAMSALPEGVREKLPAFIQRAAIPGVQSIQSQGRGMYQVAGQGYEIRLPALVQLRREWEYGRTRLNPEEMARMWEMQPEVAMGLERAAGPIREPFAQAIRHTRFLGGELETPGASRDIGSLNWAAIQEEAMRGVGAQKLQDVPRAALANIAAEQWGDVGESMSVSTSQGMRYLMSPTAMARIGASQTTTVGSGTAVDEVNPLNLAHQRAMLAGAAMQGAASTGAEDVFLSAYKRYQDELTKFASRPGVQERAIETPLRQATEGTYIGSLALNPGELLLSRERLARMWPELRDDETYQQFQEMLEQKAMLGTGHRRPVSDIRQIGGVLGLIGEGEYRRRGGALALEGNEMVVSLMDAAINRGDFDADRFMALMSANVIFGENGPRWANARELREQLGYYDPRTKRYKAAPTEAPSLVQRALENQRVQTLLTGFEAVLPGAMRDRMQAFIASKLYAPVLRELGEIGFGEAEAKQSLGRGLGITRWLSGANEGSNEIAKQIQDIQKGASPERILSRIQESFASSFTTEEMRGETEHDVQSKALMGIMYNTDLRQLVPAMRTERGKRALAEGYQASLDRQKVSLGTRALKSFMQTWGPTGRVDPETGETRGPGGWYGSYMSPEERAALGIEKGGYAPGMAGAQAQIARFLPQMTEYSHEALAEMVTTSAEGSARVLEALKTGGNISAAMGKEFEASPLGSHLRESRTFKRSQQMGENEMLTPLGEELREKGGQRAALLDFIKQKAGSASEFVQAGFKALQHQNVSPEMRRVMTAALEQMGGAATQQPAVSVGNVEQVAAAVQAAETPKPTIPSSQGALWIDTETGGLDPEKNPLLSIGAVAPSGATFYAQIKAAEGMESDAKALAVSGLDPTEGRPEAEVMQELAQFIKDNPHEVIGGANIEGFDRGFLGHAQMRTGVDLGLSKKPGLDVLEQGRKLDLGKNLDEIAEQFGISRSGAHNALTDAQMAAATYKAIEKDLAASPKKVVNPAEFAQKIKAPGGDIAARARAIAASKMNIDPSTIEGKSQLLLNMMNLGGRQASLGDWVHETLISEIKQRGYAGFKGSEFEVETPEQQLSASLTLPSGAVIGAHPDLYVPGKMGFDVKSNRMPAEHYSPQQSVQAHSLEIPFKLIQYDPAEAEKARASGDPAAIQAWVKQTLSGGPVDVPLMSMEQLEQRHEAIAQAAPELQPLAESGLASMSPEQQEQFKQLSYGQQIDWGVNAIRGGAPPTQAHPTGGTFGQRQYTSSLAGRTQPAAPTQIAAPTQQQPTQQAPLNVGGLSVMDLGGTPHIVMPLPQDGGPVHGKFWLTDISQGAKIAEGPGHLPSGTKGTLEQTERLFKMLNEQLEPAVDRLEQFKEAVAAGAELTRDERAQLGQDLGTWQRLGPLSKHISGYWEKTAGQFERALEGEGKYKDITNLRYRLGAMNEEAELAKLTMQAQGIDVSGKSPRGRMAQLLDEFSIGGAAIRMGVIGRFTTGQVSQWQEQAMPYQQSMLGFQLAMGMPYEEAMQGPVGQITAYQAALSRFQTSRGVAALQGKIGAQQMFGLYPSEEMGTLMGQVGAPVLSGLGAGLMTGVGLTTAGNLLGGATGVLGGIGSFATAAAAPLALGVGAAVGGGLAMGQIYQAGSPSNLHREWAEIAMGQRDDLSIWAKTGEAWRNMKAELESAPAETTPTFKGMSFAQQALLGISPGIQSMAEQAMGATDPDAQAIRLSQMRQKYEQSYSFQIDRAAIHIGGMTDLNLSEEQALQLGGLLTMMGISPEEVYQDQAEKYVRQFAPMMQLGQGEAQMTALTRLGGYLGIAPGRGLQEYAAAFPGVEQPAEQARWFQATQMLGGIAGQVGGVPTVSTLQQYAAMLNDIPEAQLSALAREQYGLGGIGMTLGAPAGFSSGFAELLQPQLQGYVGGRQPLPGEYGAVPGMNLGGTPKYGPAQMSAEQYMKMQSLAQFGMSQQGYNMMAGGYGLGGPLAQMFGMLEERGMGPGAPTGPALMDAQGYGYGTFERRGINWAQFGLQQRQQEASWEYQQTQNAFQMGDWGGTSSVGWGFGLTGQIQIQQELMEFTKQLRAITHEMIALQREQSMRGIEYQERGLEMSTRHSLENLGMSRRMWQENTQFSRLQMGVQWGQMETQQGWQMQDMAWNRQMAGFQYEYQQDELERSIRLATGREKQGLLRRREYQEEMYARQEDRRGVEEERAKQVMEWERQKFSLQKEHFERVTQLQEMQFNMQERHILERYALDKEKIEQQKQDMQAIWALEDERRKLQEAWEDRQQQYHLEELERQKRYYEEVVFPYQKQQHDFQLESMKYQAQSMKLQEDIEDAHAKYQAWQIQQYSPGGELYDKVMEFINEIIAALDEAQGAADQTWSNTPPEIPGYNAPYPSASGGGLAEALFAGLQGASMKLVLDDGKSFDAHIETVQDGADFRRKQAGSWGVPWK